MELAAELFAGEIAVDCWRGETRTPLWFAEWASEMWESEEEDPDASLGETDDNTQAMRMLKIAASWQGNPWRDLEACYLTARKTATRNVNLWWPEIVAVAERLIEVEHLSEDECEALIEASWEEA
jgi:hypothetical protein